MEKKLPLSREEKVKRLEEKIKQIQVQKKHLESQQKKQERKDRARELIQIGAIVSQFQDGKKLLTYLQTKPSYVYLNEAGELKRTSKYEEVKGRKAAVFIDPSW